MQNFDLVNFSRIQRWCFFLLPIILLNCNSLVEENKTRSVKPEQIKKVLYKGERFLKDTETSKYFYNNYPPTITNLAFQVDTTKQTVKFFYDLIDKEGDSVSISFLLSNNSGDNFLIKPNNVQGDIGFPVYSGKGKQIVWNYSNEPARIKDYSFKIVASDTKKASLSQIAEKWERSNLEDNLSKLKGKGIKNSKVRQVDNIRKVLSDHFINLGIQVYSQEFNYGGAEYKNIIAKIPGEIDEAKTIILCAHYDFVNDEMGADDNGSGVAGMMEIARVLSQFTFDYSIIFIGLDLEEKGFIGSSKYLSEGGIEPYERPEGVFNLDMIGYFSDQKDSQVFPKEIQDDYSEDYEELKNNGFKGDFIMNYSNEGSDSLRLVFNQIASRVVPALNIVSFSVVDNGKEHPHLFRASDHVSFWNSKIKAVSIGDTGGLRNPNYHSRTDTLGSLNLDFIGDVGKVTIATIGELASLNQCSVVYGKFE